MGSFTNYLEDKVLDHVFGGADYTRPANLFFAACTADPTEAATGSSITEPSGNNYSRVSVVNNATNFPASSGGAKSNGTAIDFPQASGSWGTITHVTICEASSSGAAIAYAPLDVSKVVSDGDTLSFAIGDLDFSLT